LRSHRLAPTRSRLRSLGLGLPTERHIPVLKTAVVKEVD
jgi:hypothetical protein